MILLHLAIKTLGFVLFCVVSGFTLLYGTRQSDIKPKYLATSVFLLGVILFH